VVEAVILAIEVVDRVQIMLFIVLKIKEEVSNLVVIMVLGERISRITPSIKALEMVKATNTNLEADTRLMIKKIIKGIQEVEPAAFLITLWEEEGEVAPEVWAEVEA
jgi:hypothetical protein